MEGMDTLRFEGKKPRMIAHRGLSGLEMENTCSAFVAAGNRTHFGIETDVHITSDGQYIIIHDDTTGRVALDEMTVENTTFETLRSLRLCDRDGKRGRKDLGLPALEEYIQICRKYDKFSVLELKNHMEEKHVAGIVETIRKEGWLENTIFISFDLENMIAVRRMLPRQKAQFLIEGDADWGRVMAALEQYDLDLDAWFGMMTGERIRQVHAAGREVNVWTVDSLEDARRLSDWGVDYITTNIIE